jgi:hypothetical protein
VDAWLVAQAWSGVGVGEGGGWQSLPARHAISFVELVSRLASSQSVWKEDNYAIHLNRAIHSSAITCGKRMSASPCFMSL